MKIPESILSDLEAVIEYHAPIGKEKTWYRLGGCADVLIRPNNEEALQTLLKRCYEVNIPVRVLGSGANVLVDDEGVDGIVILLDQPIFREIISLSEDPDYYDYIQQLSANNSEADNNSGEIMRVMAGARMEKIVINFALAGKSGLEMMAGIPASLGGAIRMNAGGKFGSIADTVHTVGCIDIQGNQIKYTRQQIDFDYRSSSIIDPVILWTEFLMQPDDPAVVHEKIKDIFAYKKNSQPMSERSAGCVFKNPKELDSPVANRRISAGKIIDEAGLKGFTIGGAMVSNQHANFVCAINDNCTARDIIAVMDHIQNVVQQKTGYQLHRELVVWKRRQ